MIDFSEVSRPAGPWVHRISPEELPLILQAASSQDVPVHQLDGTMMHTLDDVFREYVESFEFPDYFGWNYPAFSECMRELTWLPERSYLTIIRHADELLSAEPAEMETFLRIIEQVGKTWGQSFALGAEWGGGEVPFHTILVDKSTYCRSGPLVFGLEP